MLLFGGRRVALAHGALCVQDTAPLAPGVSGLLPLCPRNVSSVRSGGKEQLAAVCSAPTAAVQLPST